MMDAELTRQHGADVRFDWGPQGLRALAPAVASIVVVDVLSFTTSVTIACARGAEVLPYKWRDGDEAAFAEAHGAVLAGPGRALDRLSLSPTSIECFAGPGRIVLPSANGSAIAHAARHEYDGAVVRAGSLRNAAAVADAVTRTFDGPVAVIAAGERWRGATGPLRVAVEDLLGAGAVLAALPAAWRRSPEAAAAQAAFTEAAGGLYDRLAASPSGRELIDAGFGNDVLLAGAHDADDVVPTLVGDAFIDQRP